MNVTEHSYPDSNSQSLNSNSRRLSHTKDFKEDMTAGTPFTNRDMKIMHNKLRSHTLFAYRVININSYCFLMFLFIFINLNIQYNCDLKY